MLILFLPSIRLSYFNGPLKVYAGDEAVPHTEAHSDSSDEEDVKAEQARFQEVSKGVKVAFSATTASVTQPHGELETVAFEDPVQMVLVDDAVFVEAAGGDIGEQDDADAALIEAMFNLMAEEHDAFSLLDRNFMDADD